MLEYIPLLLGSLVVAGYAVGLRVLQRRGASWPRGRTSALVASQLCVAVAVLPQLRSHDETFWVHMSQHLLLVMAAPALLALSAPLTLALRTLPREPRQTVLAVLHCAPIAVVTTPAVAVLLNISGLVLLYMTGLYAQTLEREWLHALVHLHMFLTGCLLAWVIIGIDPMRRRPGFGVRLVTLVVTAAAHDTISKFIYARDLPVGAGPVIDRHVGAELMYYGGAVIDLAMAVALMAQWYRATGREYERTRRRAVTG